MLFNIATRQDYSQTLTEDFLHIDIIKCALFPKGYTFYTIFERRRWNQRQKRFAVVAPVRLCQRGIEYARTLVTERRMDSAVLRHNALSAQSSFASFIHWPTDRPQISTVVDAFRLSDHVFPPSVNKPHTESIVDKCNASGIGRHRPMCLLSVVDVAIAARSGVDKGAQNAQWPGTIFGW